MFRAIFKAALRNLTHDRFYSVIGILGLSVGLCVAILACLWVRHQFSYDQFISEYERSYLIGRSITLPGRAPEYGYQTPSSVAALLKLRFPEVESSARVVFQIVPLRHGDVRAKEGIFWADSNIFDILTLPTIAGDLRGALVNPDGIVLTRSIARKYFGRDSPIGETIEVDDTHTVKITAVIEDLPPHKTTLDSGIFISGRAAFSQLAKFDDEGDKPNLSRVQTYFKLRAGTDIDALRAKMPAFLESIEPLKSTPATASSLLLVRLDKVRLASGVNPDVYRGIVEAALISTLTLLIAGINFVNLSTARAARRALEVGVRKVAGAGRGTMILQFLGESILAVFVALCIAVALAEWLLPYFNKLVNSAVVFDYWRDPIVFGALLLSALTAGLLAGLYPAFVLSSFRPITALKGDLTRSRNDVAIGQGLVTLQFSILVVLVISTTVIYRQQAYARSEALRVETDQMLIVRSECNTAFKTEMRALPGVKGVACANMQLLTLDRFTRIAMPDGSKRLIAFVPVDFGFFELYGLKPFAGRFFSEERDAGIDRSVEDKLRIVISESAVRSLDFASPAEAIGKVIPFGRGEAEVIGVVADFSLKSVERKVDPTIYTAASSTGGPPVQGIINVKLAGRDIPETLAAIDKLWASTGQTESIERFFLDDYLQNLYQEMLGEARGFALCAGIAVMLACLGLLGLSTHSAERKTKEIGIRKAMGAGTAEVMRLLLWQLTKPVLWANLIAWPVAGFLMHRWLQGFAYRVDLEPWLFIVASAAALLIALLTVSAHCYLVARAKPVAALRYE